MTEKKNEDFEKVNGVLTAKPSYKVKKFIRKYPMLFRGKTIDKDVLKKVYSQIENIEDLHFISYSKDLLSYVAMTLLIKHGKYDDIAIMNAYRLLDIFLGNDEIYKSILDLDNKIVILYLGYSECENKRQGDVICQLVEYQRVRGNKTWILYKGNQNTFSSKYPNLQTVLEENGCNFTDISLDECKVNKPNNRYNGRLI